MSPAAGPVTPTASGPPGSPTRCGLPPSPPWPRPCSPVRWTPACQPVGSPAMRSTAPAPRCEPGWRAAASGMCWRWAAAPRALPAGGALGAGHPDDPGQRWLLRRRNRRSGELAYYRCFMPYPVPLAILVNVAGRRWSIEERIKTSKGLCGLDQHQVRRWRSWYRWVTLAMVAHAFLVVTALTDQARDPAPRGLVKLTCNEVQHLFAALLGRPAADRAHRLRWSVWRRRQQARARACHYRQQANGP